MDPYHQAKFHQDTIIPFRPQIRENAPRVTRLVFCTSVSLQSRLLHRFSRSVRQMTSFRARMCLLGAPKTELLHFDPIFLTKTRIFGQFSTGLNRFWPFREPKPLKPILTKPGIVDYVRDSTPHENFGGDSTTWVVWANVWLVKSLSFFFSFFLLSSARTQVAFLDRSERSIRHNACFRPRMCLWGSRQYPTKFRGQIQKTLPKIGGNRHFTAKSPK